jgi:ferredoxin-2, mitochondrial
LGCQLKVKQTMDGLRVELPRATRNMAVDGFVAKPH